MVATEARLSGPGLLPSVACPETSVAANNFGCYTSPGFSLLTTRKMPPLTTIQFTQEQARTLTGVSAETIRHWRTAVPYLAGKLGKSARFTFGDVVGLAATRELINLGVRIATVSYGVEALFHLLIKEIPGNLQGGIALVTTSGASIVGPEELTSLQLDQAGLLVPLYPLIARIREHMLPTSPISEQASLPFPPQIARSGA
jgi:hypothetical protein